VSEWDAFPVADAQGWDAFPAVAGTGEDAARSVGGGLQSVATNIAGMGGDIRETLAGGVNKLSSMAGYEIPKHVASDVIRAAGGLATGGILAGPSSAMTVPTAEKIVGPEYQPQTIPGKLVKTGVEMAPGMIGGPANLATRFGANVLAPTVASVAADEAGAGPLGQAGAAVASSVLAHRMVAPKAPKALPSAEQTLKAASEGYQAPEVTSAVWKPNTVPQLADSILTSLDRSKRNDRLAPATRGIVESMKAPVNGKAHTYEDLQTTRELLGEQAGNFANKSEQAAATQAIKLLTTYIDNIPQSHLLAGDAKALGKTISVARQNYAIGKTAERVEKKLRDADLAAGSNYSGGNINNATRQKLRPLLTNKKQGRGLTDEDLSLIETAVTGSRIGNTVRAGGKLLGGGGGLGALASGSIGHVLGGPVAALAVPAAGYAIKRVGDKITQKNADKIVKNILSRSPEADKWKAMQDRLNASKPRRLSVSQTGLLPAVYGGLLGTLAAR
jgi:hypothetical protein